VDAAAAAFQAGHAQQDQYQDRAEDRADDAGQPRRTQMMLSGASPVNVRKAFKAGYLACRFS